MKDKDENSSEQKIDEKAIKDEQKNEEDKEENKEEKSSDQKTDEKLIKDEIKKTIRFDYHNLKNDSGARNLDVVFCRNVLIYFDEAAQLAVINHFYDSMGPKSFLYIGHSESLFGMITNFEFIKTEWACFYGKGTK